MKGLCNADGTFIPFNSAELSTELATPHNAGATMTHPYCGIFLPTTR